MTNNRLCCVAYDLLSDSTGRDQTMTRLMKLLLAASAATIAAGCEHAAAPDAKEAAIEPMVEAEEAQQGLSAWAEITLDASSQPAFGASGGGGCVNGGCFSGINLAAAGNIDLSHFPPGNVALTIKFDDKAWAAGYRFPSDVWQAIGIAVIPPGSITDPIPGFGQQHWPIREFTAPVFSDGGQSIIFTDYEDDTDVYEYAINLIRPNGSPMLLDPRIQNGGGTGNK